VDAEMVNTWLACSVRLRMRNFCQVLVFWNQLRVTPKPACYVCNSIAARCFQAKSPALISTVTCIICFITSVKISIQPSPTGCKNTTTCGACRHVCMLGNTKANPHLFYICRERQGTVHLCVAVLAQLAQANVHISTSKCTSI
jgi:hypothetical protein